MIVFVEYKQYAVVFVDNLFDYISQIADGFYYVNFVTVLLKAGNQQIADLYG